MNTFSFSSLYQGQRQFSLSGNFSDYNILITMTKKAAQPQHISVQPKKSLLKSTNHKHFFARICKKLRKRHQHDYRLRDGCFNNYPDIHVSSSFSKPQTSVQGNRNFYILMMFINCAVTINMIKCSMMPASTTTMQQFVLQTSSFIAIGFVAVFCLPIIKLFLKIVLDDYCLWLCSIIIFGCLYYV